MTTTHLSLPLSVLRLSAKNTRKRRTSDSVERMARSLHAHGQLQNLVVTQGREPDTYDVEAGGTRLLALQLLQTQGQVGDDHLVDCKMIQRHEALEASTAENTLREAMHPADQFRAFRHMIEGGGASIEEVAAHFSVTSQVVQQRLKLANIAPDLFDLYESEKMKLEQLQALALTDDHAAQRRAWFGQKGAKVEHDWQRRPDALRKRIAAKEIGPDNPLVNFVGAELYQQAGGTVRRDLFSDDIYFDNPKLLETLARNKLGALELAEKAAGWAWVEVALVMDYSEQNRYPRGPFHATRRSPTKQESARLAEINERLDDIEQAQEDGAHPEYHALSSEADRLGEEREAIASARETWSAEAKAKTGVLIYFDRHQGLQVARGCLKPGQRVTAGKVAGKEKAGKRPELSADMVMRLELHRTAATREHIADRPDAALQLLLVDLAGSLIVSGPRRLSLSPTNEHAGDRGLIDTKFKDIGKSQARSALAARIERWKKFGLPTKATDLPAWVAKLDQAKRMELLALLIAMMLGNNRGAAGQAVAEAFAVDMAAWWAPTAECFLDLVPKATLAAAVSDVAGKSAGEGLLAMKKEAAKAEAAKQLASKGWLPKPLRATGYGTKKPEAAKPATGAPKKALRKPAKAATPAKKRPTRSAKAA